MIREKIQKQGKENRFSGSIIFSSLHFNYNPVQEYDNGLIKINSSRELQIIRNCLFYCSHSRALRGKLLQRQARRVIEGKNRSVNDQEGLTGESKRILLL